MTDDFDLQRFVDAQEGVFERVRAELAAGQKRSHWMWFVFPQIAGLGRSTTAQRFAIGSAAEARAYLAHPVLGQRLRTCARIVAATDGRTAEEIFGSTDAMKLRSSMTVFAAVADGEPAFRAVLDRFFGGEADPLTIKILEGTT